MNSSAPTAAAIVTRRTRSRRSSRKPSSARRARAPRGRGRAAGAHRARRGRDRQEARGVDEQRRPRAQRREPRGQHRPGREAGVARRFDDARGLGHAPRAGDGRDQGELGRLGERVAGRQQRREREDRRQVAAERQRGGDERLRQRGGDQHADALEAVGDEPGQRRERDHGHQRRREQRRYRQAAARQLVDLQRQHDQRQQVAGRREEDGARQQAQIARHGRGPTLARGPDVLVEPEAVVRVVGGLDARQPGVVGAVAGAHGGVALLEQAGEVEVGLAVRERDRGVPERARVGDVGRVVGGVVPGRVDAQHPLRAAVAERGLLGADAARSPRRSGG